MHAAERPGNPSTIRNPHRERPARGPSVLFGAWALFCLAALLLLDAIDLVLYGVVVPLAALGLAWALRGAARRSGLRLTRGEVDRRDLTWIGALYAGVVGLFALAFVGFTTDRTAGLFIAFAAGLLLGVIGPLAYTRRRGRPLADLGLSLGRLPVTIGLGLALAGVQFALTLWGYDLPADREDWLPLLLMALVVGLFEAVFFRGFVQNRLVASFGEVPGIGVAAALYALYHVGYGMGGQEMVFLLGLGVVYAVAFRLAGSVLVLWPLLTPLGSFYNNVDAGDIELPWASMIGFGEVLIVMLIAVAVAFRRQRRGRAPAHAPRTAPTV